MLLDELGPQCTPRLKSQDRGGLPNLLGDEEVTSSECVLFGKELGGPSPRLSPRLSPELWEAEPLPAAPATSSPAPPRASWSHDEEASACAPQQQPTTTAPDNTASCLSVEDDGSTTQPAPPSPPPVVVTPCDSVDDPRGKAASALSTPRSKEVQTPPRRSSSRGSRAGPIRASPQACFSSPAPAPPLWMGVTPTPSVPSLSTPSRRVAASFGSGGLFRETPSPRPGLSRLGGSPLQCLSHYASRSPSRYGDDSATKTSEFLSACSARGSAAASSLSAGSRENASLTGPGALGPDLLSVGHLGMWGSPAGSIRSEPIGGTPPSRRGGGVGGHRTASSSSASSSAALGGDRTTSTGGGRGPGPRRSSSASSLPDAAATASSSSSSPAAAAASMPSSPAGVPRAGVPSAIREGASPARAGTPVPGRAQRSPSAPVRSVALAGMPGPMHRGAGTKVGASSGDDMPSNHTDWRRSLQMARGGATKPDGQRPGLSCAAALAAAASEQQAAQPASCSSQPSQQRRVQQPQPWR